MSLLVLRGSLGGTATSEGHRVHHVTSILEMSLVCLYRHFHGNIFCSNNRMRGADC